MERKEAADRKRISRLTHELIRLVYRSAPA